MFGELDNWEKGFYTCGREGGRTSYCWKEKKRVNRNNREMNESLGFKYESNK